MHTVSVRELDGSLIIALPADLAEELNLTAGSEVRLQQEGDRLSVGKNRSRYRLEDLLAECDFTLPVSSEEREWMDVPSVGRETQS